jgi:hypothetical protein
MWLQKPSRKRDLKNLLQRRVPPRISTQLLCEPLVIAHNFDGLSWEDLVSLLQLEFVPCQDDMWVSSDESCNDSSDEGDCDGEAEIHTDEEEPEQAYGIEHDDDIL